MTTPDQVQSLRALIMLIETDINNRRVFPRLNTHLDVVLLAFLSKSLSVTKAIAVLVEQGFVSEAFALSRTQLEIYFTARYIANKDCHERAKQYLEFLCKERDNWWKIVKKYFPSIQAKGLSAEERAIASQYPNPHWWTGGGGHAKRIAMEQDTHEISEAGEAMTCESDYEIYYKWTSEHVHVSVRALDGHIGDRWEPFTVGPRHNYLVTAGRVLVVAAEHLAKTVVAVYRCLKQAQPEGLDTALYKAMG